MFNFRPQFPSNWEQARFSPAALFSAGEAGFWSDVAPNVLWQDTARTTPVTAAGQAVASWGLRTSTGMIYAEQATAGNRPLYQVDATGRGYLEFNGATSNRFMQTSAVNFSGTDEITVIAGIRKASDATRGIIVELANGASNAFRMQAPSGALNDTEFTAGGTTLQGATSAIAAPVTAVLTGISDISTDTLLQRRNGVQVASQSADQGTGNFQNAIVYIGMRTGTVFPLNGRIYGLIMRGALTSGATLTSAERWMNARTGAF